jgi:hypothetical protein
MILRVKGEMPMLTRYLDSESAFSTAVYLDNPLSLFSPDYQERSNKALHSSVPGYLYSLNKMKDPLSALELIVLTEKYLIVLTRAFRLENDSSLPHCCASVYPHRRR